MKFQFSTKSIIFSIVVIVTVLFSDPAVKYLADFILKKEAPDSLNEKYYNLLIQAGSILICMLVTFFLAGFSISKWKEMLGFDKGFLTPAVYAFISCLPMFIGAAVMHGHQPGGTAENVFLYSIWPGFNEEVIFRIFLTGILVRYAGWNFVAAALLSGFVFAKGHLYQAADLLEGIKIFIFVSGVGVGFAVFCWMWNWNIWFTIFMHTFMNMAFVLFISNGNVLLNPVDNILRAITIGMAILFSVFYRIMCFRKNAVKPA